MSETKNLVLLVNTGEAAPACLSRDELLERMALVFDKRFSFRHDTHLDMEIREPDEVDAERVDGNSIFMPILDELQKLGYSIMPTVGFVRETLGLTDEEIHYLGCHCHDRERTGESTAIILRAIADGSWNRTSIGRGWVR